MSIKSTLLGIAVLAALAAGAWWARSPSQTAATAPVTAKTASGDDALPDATLSAATADSGGVKITLAVSPNPPVAFAKTRVRVRAEANGSPVAIESGRVSFEMVMPMGDHRYTLVPARGGGWKPPSSCRLDRAACGAGMRPSTAP